MKKDFTLTILLLLVTMAVTFIGNAQTTYTWAGGPSGSYATAANWSPTRTSPATSDILQFTSSANVTGVPSQTIAQLILSGTNTAVYLRAGSSAAKLTISNTGVSTPVLSIPSTDTLHLGTGTAAQDSISIAFGGSGNIASFVGTLILDSTYTGTYNNCFYSANSTTTITGNIINGGNISATTSTLIFNSGSNYIHNRVDDGTAQYLPVASLANANVTIQSLRGSNTATMNNFPTTIASLTVNCPNQTGRIYYTLLSGSSFSITNNLSITMGTGSPIFENYNTPTPFTFSVGGNMYLSNCNFIVAKPGQNVNLTVTDSLVVNANGNLNGIFGSNNSPSTAYVVNIALGNYYQPGSGSSVTLNNTSSNTSPDTVNFIVTGNFTFTAGSFVSGALTSGIGMGYLRFKGSSAQTFISTSAGVSKNIVIEIANTGGNVSLGSSTTINGILKLTSGNLVLGANNLTLSSTASILPTTPTSASYINTSGTGTFILNAVGTAASIFPVGTASNYTPIVLTGTTNSPNITVGASGTLTYSPFAINNVVDMQWSLLSSTSSTANVTFQYNSGNVGSSYTSTGAVLGVYNVSNTTYAESTLGSVSGSNPYIATPSSALSLPTSVANLYVIGNPNSFVGVPSAPTIGIATVIGLPVTVSFTPPSGNAFYPITQYTVTSSPGGVKATGTSSPITINGLTNGVSYTFTVTATNILGTGAASVASNAVIPTPNVYYFSSSIGNDSNTIAQAKNPSTPWKTINKLNSMMGTLLPGDEVLFNRGDTFTGTINITTSGILNYPIIFSAYGTGNNPFFDGRLALATWTNIGTNLWQTVNPLIISKPTALYMNDSLKAIARYPNSTATNGGYLNIDSCPANSKTTFTCKALTGTPNFTGAEVVVRSSHWTLDKLENITQSGSTITSIDTTTYAIPINNGFFLQNNLNCLDTDGEWVTKGDTITIYSTINPSSRNVAVANTNSSITDTSHSYIIINGLAFKGSNSTAIALKGVTYCAITNCNFTKSGINDIDVSSGSSITTDSINISNNTFSLTQGSSLNISSTRLSIIGNTFTNISTVAGMGESGEKYYGLSFYSMGGALVENNIINGTGYDGMTFTGCNILVNNNVVSNFCSVTDDGGGIYTFAAVTDSFVNRSITNNIVMNGIGAPLGANSTTYIPANGIYLDGVTPNVTATGNTVANCPGDGFVLNGGSSNTIKNNTTYNCMISGIDMHQIEPNYASTQALKSLPNYSTNNTIDSNSIVNTIQVLGDQFSCGLMDDHLVESNAQAGFGNYGSVNKNIYCNPFLQTDMFLTQYYPLGSLVSKHSSLSEWNALTGYDSNSSTSPVNYSLYSSLIGSNGITNGTFNSNASGWHILPGTGNTVDTAIVSGKLDGNCLSVTSLGSVPSSTSQIFYNLPSITAGNSYWVSLSALGTKTGTFNCWLYGATDNNHSRTVNLSTTRLDKQMLFTATSTSSSALLLIQFSNSDSTFYLDNVQFYQATPTNAANYVRFAYNTSANDSSIIADKNYITPTGTVYNLGSTVTLPPFSSVVLLKDTTILNYYYAGTGSLNNTNNWGNNANGTGLHPANFTTSGQQFYLQNIDSVALTGNLTIGGINSQLTVGNGVSPTVLTIPNNDTLNATLNISNAATLINQNTFNPTYGTLNVGSTVTFNGNVLQTIPSATYGNLVLHNTAGAILGGTVATTNLLIDSAGMLTTGNNNLTLDGPAIFTPGTNLNISGGTTDFRGNNVNFQSSLNGTASIAAINGTLLNATNVTAQRYITAKTARKYSYVGSPIIESIRNGWQQQVYITGQGSGGVTCGSTNGNGGLIIDTTGNDTLTTPGIVMPDSTVNTDRYNSNGFDVTPTNNPSMFTYNAQQVLGSRYVSVPNTYLTNLTPGIGYVLNIRGNRNSTDVTCANQLETAAPTAPEAVTLSATGTVTTGNLSVSLYDTTLSKYTLLANPYPSTISFTSFQNSNNVNTYNKMWTYSPFGNGNFTTYSNGVIANGATGYDNIHGDYIASGQAFFVEATQAGSAGKVTFQESHKSNGVVPNTQYFGTTVNKLIRVGLKAISDSSLLDQVVVRYNDNGTATYNPTFDAESFSAGNQTLVTLKQDTRLAIATHSDSFTGDTALLGVGSSTNGAFSLLFSDFDGVDASKGITLIDNFLGSSQEIRLNPVYDFNITTDSASQGNNRFMVVVGNTIPLAVNAIELYVIKNQGGAGIKWLVANQSNIHSYTVERGTDNTIFTGIKTVDATADDNYSIEDNNIPDSSNTFYFRIKAVKNDGYCLYSNVAKLTINNLSLISIYPNPAKGDNVNLLIDKLPTGSYTLVVYNSLGEKVVLNKIDYDGSTKNYLLDVSGCRASGTYCVVIERLTDNTIVGKLNLVVAH
jgi:hypothetical protein